MSATSQPVAYLKRSCPHCLRLRIFLTEAGLGNTVRYEVFDDGDPTHVALRTRMEQAGLPPSFPAVEFTTGTLETGTDALIARFAVAAGTDPRALPLLAYYQDGVFQRHGEMFRKLRELEKSLA